MLLLDGKIAAAAVKTELQSEMQLLLASGKRPPHLAAILVGANGASETYVASKVKNCEEVGFKSTLIRFDSAIEENLLLDAIITLNNDPGVDGILVQLPLPKQISEQKVIETIDPSKDVDGFHPNWYRVFQHLFLQHHLVSC
jgi:methylenetetrahydrofolate dehydrogenase (NADP+)/methenyltetrahydrofolate cyclohydrolase